MTKVRFPGRALGGLGGRVCGGGGVGDGGIGFSRGEFFSERAFRENFQRELSGRAFGESFGGEFPGRDFKTSFLPRRFCCVSYVIIDFFFTENSSSSKFTKTLAI